MQSVDSTTRLFVSRSCRLRFALLSGCTLLSSCGSSISTPETSSDFTSAVVYGRVSDESDNSLALASVKASVHSDSSSCRAGSNGLNGGAPVIADAQGRYRAVVSVPLAPTTLCVSVSVRPNGAPLSALFVKGGERTVRMRVLGTGVALDSVAYNVQIAKP
jgi:hypothetical protein